MSHHQSIGIGQQDDSARTSERWLGDGTLTLKAWGLEDTGAERRGSPDASVPQERTGTLGVTVMG